MDPDQIFKRFFGASFPEFGHRRFSRVDVEDGDSKSGDFRQGGGLFDDLHLQIQEQMEEMDKQMQEAFRIFSVPSHIPSGVPTLPGGSSESNPHSGSNARDHMLKEGERSTRPSQSPEQPPQSFFGALFSPWLEEFTGTPRWNRIPPSERRDCDIDSESPNKEEIVDIYRQTKDPFGHFFGGGRSMNVQTIVGADGVVEERRTVRDSNGREETTVTRRMGDKSHTVTTIKDKKGQEEKHEVFQNIDKDKMSEFDKQWQGKGHHVDPVITDPNTPVQIPASQGGTLSDNRGFFRKLFGF